MTTEPHEKDPFPDLRRWAENRLKARNEDKRQAEHVTSASGESPHPERVAQQADFQAGKGRRAIGK